MSFRTAVVACFGFGTVAHAEESLTLLQLQARRGNESQCPTTSVSSCQAVGDTHVQNTRGGNFDCQTAGVMPMATHCNGDHIQFYQCYWAQWAANSRNLAGVRAHAAKFGDTTIRVITLNGQWAQVCIDSLDGCKSLDHYVGDKRLEDNDVMVQRWSTGVRVSRPSTGWAVWHSQNAVGTESSYFNAYLSAPNMRSDTQNDVCLGKRCTYPAINWLHSDDPASADYDAMLFTAEDADNFCKLCKWAQAGGGAECKKPPPAPPPPTAQKVCQDNKLAYNASLEDGSPDPDSAVGCCTPVEGDPALFKQCLFDFCIEAKLGKGEKEPPSKEVCNAYQLVEGSGGRPICLTDQAVADCPKPPAAVCANSPKLDLTNVVENNLEQPGGRLVYGDAGTINGKQVDVVVTAADGYTPFIGGDSTNGNAGEFGTINVACGSSADLTFTIVQAGTNTPEPIETAVLTYYDLDEGKRAKGRMTVKTCDQQETILAENTELTQVVDGDCVSVTSSKKGSAKDNPTSLMELDDIQRARAVTYSFSKLSSWKSTVSLAKGAGGRSFFFSLQPAEACTPGVNLGALGWVPPQPGDKVVPEDRKACTIGGCPWGKGCCMDKSMFLAQSWARPNRRIRDTCLSMTGMSWCTMGNKKQTKDFIVNRDGGLNFAQDPPMKYLMKLGMFGANRERPNQPVVKVEGEANGAAFPELGRFEKLGNQCISKRIGKFFKCTSGTYEDTPCQQQAAVACIGTPGCKAFNFQPKKFKGTGYALGKKVGKKSKGCLGYALKAD